MGRFLAASSFANPRASQRHLICILAAWAVVCFASDPAPIAVPVGPNFYGYDGLWSGVNIRVGGPPAQSQWLTVFPFTASPETWVIGPGGCDGTTLCQQKRGGLFFKNESTTWNNQGYYQLGFDADLGDTGYADYGLDDIGLSDQITLAGQTIGIINTTEFWLGQLGLGVQQTRLSGTTNHLSFLSSMVENASLIPSHSYGYTAGAYYMYKTVPSSLTLGGVDTNRFIPNHASFALSPNYQPVVAVDSISVSCAPLESAASYPSWLKTNNPLSLLDSSQATYFTIDTSTPFLWFPEAVCDSFASAFNLTYNDTLELYLFNQGGPTSELLTQWNMTFTFSLTESPGSSNKVDLAVSYNAFNLALSYPFPGLDANFTSPSVPYFPLRRATDNTQYTIGRAFLQETYLTVDYERSNFSVSQATFALDSLTNVNLVPITRPANSNFTGPAQDDSSGITTGAKAGIGVAVALGALVITALILYIGVRRRRVRNKDSSEKAGSHRRSFLGRLVRSSSGAEEVSELPGNKHQPTEISADPSNTRFELPACAPIEMPAAEVPHTFYAQSGGSGTALSNSVPKNDPRNPAELGHRNSTSKSIIASERSTSPTPPAYSPAEVGQRFSNSISPNSPYNSHGFGTMSSGEQGISPVGHGGNTRSSSHNSSSPLSPLSPNDTYSRFPHMHAGHSEPSSGSGNSLLIPSSHERAPSRSASRGSRFVEEGLDERENKNSETQLSSDRTRFSWED